MIGDRIREARERRGWNQTELAAKLGVGYKTVSNWETGATMPQNRLGMLREIFGAELDETSPDSGDPIRSYSELALLNELMRRALARGQNGGTE